MLPPSHMLASSIWAGFREEEHRHSGYLDRLMFRYEYIHHASGEQDRRLTSHVSHFDPAER